MKKAGNYVISILGARSKEYLILENEMRSVSDELIVTTDDGSYGEKGLVTHALQKLIDAGRKLDQIITIGPAVMMKYVAETSRPARIPTIASLNSIMVDGTGMCGGCRVTVGGKIKFVCVDGPEFDAHEVEWKEMMMRLNTYKEHECRIMKGVEEAR
jgi:ferredoxin--NADP+ reductase